MRTKLLLCALPLVLFFFLPKLSAQQVEKTLVKSFDVQGKQNVTLDFTSGNVEVKEWKESTMRVQMTVSIPAMNDATMRALIGSGRYNLLATNDGSDMTISTPGLKQSIKFQGQDLKDVVSYIVYTPSSVNVRQNTVNSASVPKTSKINKM